MKKILYLDHTAKMGGGEIALLNLIKALDKTEFSPVVVLASEGRLGEKLTDAGIETHVIPLNPRIVEMKKDRLGFLTLLSLGKVFRLFCYSVTIAKWAKQRKIDLIHTNSLKSDLYGGIAGRLAGIPVLWHVRDNITPEYLPNRVVTLFRMLARIIPKAVVANSESTLKTLRLNDSAERVGQKNKKAGPHGEVVYSGHISYSQIPVANPGLDNGCDAKHDPIIALVGRIAPWKGQHIFLQASVAVIKKFPSTKFWIVGAPLFGEDDYERELHKMAEDLNVAKNVEFLGFRNDVSQLLAGVDIVAHASTVGEPFGQVVIEGMAASKPVIGTDGGALPEIVIPGETGLLVPMADANAMADAIVTLLANPEIAKSMGAKGRERVKQNFTLEHTSAKMKLVYAGIFGSDGSGDNSKTLRDGNLNRSDKSFDISAIRDAV